MSGEVKTFLDNWSVKFGLFQDRKMRNKVGAVFATGAAVSREGVHDPGTSRPSTTIR